MSKSRRKREVEVDEVIKQNIQSGVRYVKGRNGKFYREDKHR